MKKIVLLSLMMCLLGASMPGAQEATKEEAFAAAVHAMLEQYSAAMLAGDSDAWLELWGENAVQLPPNSLMVEGKESLKNKIETRFRILTYNIFKIEVTAMHVENTLGYVFGNYQYAETMKGSGVRIDRVAKYVTILEQQDDGTWKIVLDCSNLNR